MIPNVKTANPIAMVGPAGEKVNILSTVLHSSVHPTSPTNPAQSGIAIQHSTAQPSFMQPNLAQAHEAKHAKAHQPKAIERARGGVVRKVEGRTQG